MKEPEAAAAGIGTAQMTENQTETHSHTQNIDMTTGGEIWCKSKQIKSRRVWEKP